jgi:guanylate kinase
LSNRAKLFVFSAPSGSGKTTIVRSILESFPNFIFSISATTRKKRDHEIDGEDYFFISDSEFLKQIDEGKFVEWERFYGYYYGTLKSFVDSKLEEGSSLVFEVDVKGALSIKKHYPDSVLIFIMPPSIEELKNRLIKRKTETSDDLKKRIERAELELSYKDKFDHLVVNNELEPAIEEVKNIIKLELNEVIKNGMSSN